MVVKVRPNDKDAKLKYQECHKIVKQKAFERAIASDPHRRSVVDTLDIESMSEPKTPEFTPKTAPSHHKSP
ncbi:serine/threonine-protein phosphatase 5-like [Patagioenas fasciata monilis]|uniref:Serine/threonine-protein phosphatase 5-like n=1 Tax=Patagioenas fasciata monilis TaxID=372326 RepID=A0A1V4JGK2_PATFA|nr:serine/threonine-protein phosphatase 5-like [Patagioenas fasciata monilis]